MHVSLIFSNENKLARSASSAPIIIAKTVDELCRFLAISSPYPPLSLQQRCATAKCVSYQLQVDCHRVQQYLHSKHNTVFWGRGLSLHPRVLRLRAPVKCID